MRNLTELLSSRINEGVLSKREDDKLNDLAEEFGYETLFNELIQWLPNDKVKEFISDFKRNYDVTESKEEETETDSEDSEEKSDDKEEESKSYFTVKDIEVINKLSNTDIIKYEGQGLKISYKNTEDDDNITLMTIKCKYKEAVKEAAKILWQLEGKTDEIDWDELNDLYPGIKSKAGE